MGIEQWLWINANLNRGWQGLQLLFQLWYIVKTNQYVLSYRHALIYQVTFLDWDSGGWNCVLLRFRGWSPIPEHLRMGLYLEIGLLQMYVRWGYTEVRWASNPIWLGFCKKEIFGQRHTYRKNTQKLALPCHTPKNRQKLGDRTETSLPRKHDPANNSISGLWPPELL